MTSSTKSRNGKSLFLSDLRSTSSIDCSPAMPESYTATGRHFRLVAPTLRRQKQHQGGNMKKLLASTLTVLLFATTAFAQVDDHAKAKKGAVIGGIAGA